MDFIDIEGWKNPKYLDINAFNTIEETLVAFHEINNFMNDSILPVKFIDDIKNQEFNFYKLVKEGIALESYKFSSYAADVIVYLNMLMEESIESNDLMELLQSLFADAKTRLSSMENLIFENYDNNRILKSICEQSFQKKKKQKIDRNSCISGSLYLFSSIFTQSNNPNLTQPLLPNESENENRLSVEIVFQKLMSKYEKSLNIVFEIKQFWKNQVLIISKFIDIFEKNAEGTKEIWLSQKNGQDIRGKWEEEKKIGEEFYNKIRNLLN